MGFKITGGKGFHVSFPNGYTVSVQFGPGNYCDHYDRRIGYEDAACGAEGSTLAEVGIWSPAGDFVTPAGENDVIGRQSAAEVLALMNWAASQGAASTAGGAHSER